MTYSKQTLKTTTDCIKAAEAIKADAKQVTNQTQHAAWWDNKVDFENFINDLLGTGGFEGDALNELLACKTTIYYAERTAGHYPE